MYAKPNFIIKTFIISTLIMASISVNAQHRGRRHDNRAHWHGGDIHRFEIHDRALWRGGHWRHVRYGGRFGWWWVVGPSWYFYPQAVYPYPDPYTPPVVIVTPSQESPTAAQPPVQNWYYCEASKEYYPYISSCPGGWKSVPATPAGVPSTPSK